ncbi:membrane protein insertase YidC [Micromonospora sonneratiae]|uniref:Membrane protein insertase YidC n=1 Tax=Micromonospora sonneratiae TaxID=1184706 RepID=A0ABW3YDT6_9ACTN
MLAFAPLDGVVDAASTAVSVLAAVVAPLAGTAATAAAIVLFTVLVRLLISPLTWAQVRGQQRQAALAPKIQEIQKRYGDQPEQLRTELVTLYREAGASPLAGCLPTLLQAPFFFVMYRLFTTSAGSDGLLTERLLGVPLGHHASDGLAGAAGPLFAVLLAVLVGLAWWSSRRMRRAATTAESAAAPNPLTRVLQLLPYGTPLLALVMPLAAVLYLATTTAWSAAEQAVFRRR